MSNSGNPKISVLMAVYNAERYIRRSVESVLAQTFVDFELICVDDGSSDGSLDILNDLARRDSRIRVVANLHKGACATLNVCLDKARGEYVTFIDNDDEYHPKLLEVAYESVESAGTDVVIWDWIGVNDDGTVGGFSEIRHVPSTKCLDDPVGWSIDGRHVSFWCKIYRREVLSGLKFHTDVIHGDVVFQWELLLGKALTVGYLPLSLYRYYVRPESMDHCPMTSEKAVDRVRCAEKVAGACVRSGRMTKRIASMLAEMVWSAYKVGRVYPGFRTDVLREISRCLKNGSVRMGYFPLIRRCKIFLSLLFLKG